MARKRRGYNRAQLEQLAMSIAKQEGIPPALFKALITAESGWNPTAGSSAGARGLTQLMPATAKGLGVSNILDPEQNLRGGAKYLRSQLNKFGSPRLALSAYNSGPGGSESSGRVEGFEETQNYVRKVMELEKRYRGMGASSLGDVPLPGGGGSGPTLAPAKRGGGLSSGQLGLLARVGPLSQRAASAVSDRQDSAPETTTDTDALGFDPSGTPTAGQEPAVGGLNAEFAKRFKALQAAVKRAGGDLTIYSGGRSADHQAKLYDNALKKYGSESEARKWVAPPGKSNHDLQAGLKYGLGPGAVASDLRGDLALAHKLASKFGLIFPLANEAWHIEMAGIRGK